MTTQATPTKTEPTTHTLDVPGATVTYDIRRNDSSTEPILMMIGSPMGASGFPTLASYFADRTVVTYDPRGVERSTKDDDTSESNPDQHAEDVHAVISALGGGPVDLFASSGGAVTALALIAKHPADVRTVVAHEPPLASLVPDHEAALAAVHDIRDTYQREGKGPAMAKFMKIVMHKGPITADFLAQPAPDPAMFGMSSEDDGSRNDVLLGQNLIGNNLYEPDFDTIRAAKTHLVIGVGAESDGELAHRGGESVAKRLGLTPVIFPSGHGGFQGDEYGMRGEPEAFAAKLREVLASA
jgi:pimeloyl-ACP methyl ester carboxylesterase